VTPAVHDRPVAELDPVTLYRILALRSEVFVVEQACVYLDPDGRDVEPGARQLWIDGDGGAVLATARVLVEPTGGHRIGRIATAPAHRRSGLAARLVEHFLDAYAGPWHLDAQAHLAGWYGRFGFEVSGPEYDDDGILHVPMVRQP
jgi:ElaA protein